MDVKTVDAGLLQSRYRLTKQRAAVLRALGDGTHLSAEDIHLRVVAEMPTVSLGTVYRTLEILRGLGLVQSFTFGNAARYEAALDKHHHLVCSVCRRIENVHLDGIGRLAGDVAARNGFHDIDYTLTIVGVCSSCSTTDGLTSSPNGSSA